MTAQENRESDMSTREMLELAAKAVGIVGVYTPEDGPLSDAILYNDADDCAVYWGPHVDDGDSRRLEVALRMSVSYEASDDGMVVSINGRRVTAPLGDDAAAATRLAVLQMAALRGKAMP